MPSLSAAIAASASGLNAERARIEVAVSNLANSESTRSASGTPYRRRDVVLAADGVKPFEGTLQEAGATGVKVAAVVEDQTPFKRRYEPSHPDADKDGFVALAERGAGRRDGRHAVGRTRLPGEPDRDQPRSRHASARAGARTLRRSLQS